MGHGKDKAGLVNDNQTVQSVLKPIPALNLKVKP